MSVATLVIGKEILGSCMVALIVCHAQVLSCVALNDVYVHTGEAIAVIPRSLSEYKEVMAIRRWPYVPRWTRRARLSEVVSILSSAFSVP